MERSKVSELFGVGDDGLVPAEGGELALAAFGDEPGHLGIFVVGEVEEGGGGGELFALEEHGDEGRGEDEAGGDLGFVEADDVLEAVAGGAIADLVVVLDEADEVMGGEAVDGAAVASGCGSWSSRRRRRRCRVRALARFSKEPKSS